jgi:glucose-1-phosphate thymidylyltransferase
MIDKGAKLKVIDVEGWYDAGKLDTLLETNRIVLDKGAARRPKNVEASVTIHDPVYIEDDVILTNSTIGPNVTLGKGSKIEGSTLTDTIVGSKGTIRHSQLHNSLIGDDVIIEGLKGELTVSDHSEIRGT